jgi:3-methyladenine DNA glycosylase AlkC
MEPFKTRIRPEIVRASAAHLKRVWPAFKLEAFVREASAGLDAMEFKARAMHVADALEKHLPDDFTQAAQVIEAALGPPVPFDSDGEPLGLASDSPQSAGIDGWIIWSFGEFVARRGQEDVPRALACLRELTQRFSAEFSIRPFLAKHTKMTLAILAKWLRDPSAHVRRLASEGSRTRLPWGMKLQCFIDAPELTIALVTRLQDDPSGYVRRSVANHMNDLAKDHPDRVVRWIRDGLVGASPKREALLRHAARGLIKDGHHGVLAVFGMAAGFDGKATLLLGAKKAQIGTHIDLEVELVSTSNKAQSLVVDYIVSFTKSGAMPTSGKTFKGWKLTLAPKSAKSMIKKHSLKVVTTRKHHPGRHTVTLQVNGDALATAEFVLEEATAKTTSQTKAKKSQA